MNRRSLLTCAAGTMLAPFAKAFGKREEEVVEKKRELYSFPSTEDELNEEHEHLCNILKGSPFGSCGRFVYVISGKVYKGKQFQVVCPQSWVRVIHEPHPFSKFVLRNPNKPSGREIVLDRDRVKFVYDPFGLGSREL